MLLLASLRDYARRTSRAVAFSLAGAVFLSIGAAFLTFAAWLMLERWGGAIFAAQVVGSVYFASGLIFFAIASAQKRRVYRRPPPTPAAGAPDPVLQMIEGFLMGLAAGRGTSRNKPR
ncbi:phage holin family protein [Puniceibacterium sediminis]|uniref:Putative Holin-X, holin superfamily III n=1 Tax=Puniceibacterium sediminis TaxID=1608407 RepID=A0A238UU98_9RHOB|nr:phage holin family protein [Puniceibacterium sediminis]SNR25576.1 Putative Holin-X, holin superfamily III [Puniceibacterium sediminis]